jgi:hypothetical protein
MAATKELQVIWNSSILTIDTLVKLMDQMVLAGTASGHSLDKRKVFPDGGNFEAKRGTKSWYKVFYLEGKKLTSF